MRRGRCAPGCKQIIDQDNPLTRRDGVGLHLDLIGAVLERVFIRHGLARQLALLAYHDEATPECVRHRRCDQKAAGFDTCEEIGLVTAYHIGETLHRLAPGPRVGEQGRDVVKEDTWLGKVRNFADVVAQVEGGHGCPQSAQEALSAAITRRRWLP